jgi:hypothetical protein
MLGDIEHGAPAVVGRVGLARRRVVDLDVQLDRDGGRERHCREGDCHIAARRDDDRFARARDRGQRELRACARVAVPLTDHRAHDDRLSDQRLLRRDHLLDHEVGAEQRSRRAAEHVGPRRCAGLDEHVGLDPSVPRDVAQVDLLRCTAGRGDVEDVSRPFERAVRRERLDLDLLQFVWPRTSCSGSDVDREVGACRPGQRPQAHGVGVVAGGRADGSVIGGGRAARTGERRCDRRHSDQRGHSPPAPQLWVVAHLVSFPDPRAAKSLTLWRS